MRAHRYLGLDLGTFTGYALAEGAKVFKSGVKDFSARRNEHVGHTFLAFQNFLHGIGRVDEIYYERIAFTGKFNCSDGHERYHGLLAFMNAYAAGYGVPTIGIWPGTLKKDFTGSGAADKAQMCAAAHAIGWRGGKPGTDLHNDEADAIGLLATQLKNRYGVSLRCS